MGEASYGLVSMLRNTPGASGLVVGTHSGYRAICGPFLGCVCRTVVCLGRRLMGTDVHCGYDRYRGCILLSSRFVGPLDSCTRVGEARGVVTVNGPIAVPICFRR